MADEAKKTQDETADEARPVLDLQGEETPEVEGHMVGGGGNCISALSVVEN